MKKSDTAKLEIERFRIELHEMPDGAVRAAPCIRFTRGDGPKLWLTATVHGNEVTGLRTLQKLYPFLRSKPFRGTVTVSPLLNPSGCERNRREVSETSEDLNRCFPGRADGSFMERIAHSIYQAIASERPDLHIDLHADSTASVAYVILDRYLDSEAFELRDKIEMLASAFDAVRVYDWPTEQYRSNRLDASLSGSLLNSAHVPSFVIELGGLRCPDESMAELAFQGLLGVMGRLGMFAATHEKLETFPVILRRCTPLRAERSGLVRYLVRPGQKVDAGTPLCELSDVFAERVEVLCSPAAGVVIAMPDRYWVSPGMGLLTLAVADE